MKNKINFLTYEELSCHGAYSFFLPLFKLMKVFKTCFDRPILTDSFS